MDLPLDNDKPISIGGSTSRKKYLRPWKKLCNCSRETSETMRETAFQAPRSVKERKEVLQHRSRDAPEAHSEDHGEGGCALQPMEIHVGTEIHLQPMVDYRLERLPDGGCDPLGSLHWNRLLTESVVPCREEPPLDQVFWHDL